MQIHDKGLADVYTDFSGLNQLRHNAAANANAASQETAEQFEALFLQVMLKSMRATVGKTMLDSNQSDMARDMYDKQLATTLAKKGAIGIGAMVLQQLGASTTDTPESNPQPGNNMPAPAGLSRNINFVEGLWGHKSEISKPDASLPPKKGWENPEDFVAALLPSARHAAEKLGTKPEAILAVAALETGWGKHVMRDGDGNPSNNLFGIKSSRDWTDKPTTWAQTLEFENGVMQQKTEPFRTYESIDESVNDFAEFVQSNRRYQSALEHAHDPERFLQELHKAGYATDPDYGSKVNSVMSRVTAYTQELV